MIWGLWAMDCVTSPSGARRILARTDRFGPLWRSTGTFPTTWHVSKARAEAIYGRRCSLGMEQWERDYPRRDVGGV